MQQKNHKFFIKEVMKNIVIILDQKHFGTVLYEKAWQNYERVRKYNRYTGPVNSCLTPCIFNCYLITLSGQVSSLIASFME